MTTARPGYDPSTPPQPAMEPGESPLAYERRLQKWATDNARWAGQKRALELLDRKSTSLSPTSEY